jgi:hypothetical protein
MVKKILNSVVDLQALKGVLPIEKGGTGGTSIGEIVGNVIGIPRTHKNAPNGVAGLDSQGKIPMSLIPAVVVPALATTV